MLRRVCDRCGEEIVPKRLTKIFKEKGGTFKEIEYDFCLYNELERYGSKRVDKWDLCHECVDSLLKFMKGAETED